MVFTITGTLHNNGIVEMNNIVQKQALKDRFSMEILSYHYRHYHYKDYKNGFMTSVL